MTACSGIPASLQNQTDPLSPWIAAMEKRQERMDGTGELTREPKWLVWWHAGGSARAAFCITC